MFYRYLTHDGISLILFEKKFLKKKKRKRRFPLETFIIFSFLSTVLASCGVVVENMLVVYCHSLSRRGRQFVFNGRPQTS